MSYLIIPAVKVGAAFVGGAYVQSQTQSLYEYVKCKWYGQSEVMNSPPFEKYLCVQCGTIKDNITHLTLAVAFSALLGYYSCQRSKLIGLIASITSLCLGLLRIKMRVSPYNIGIIIDNEIDYKLESKDLNLKYIFTGFPYPGSSQPLWHQTYFNKRVS